MSKAPNDTQETKPRRSTRQRSAILQVLEASEGPLSTTEILERAQQTLPRLGIATVYRTLQLLQETEMIEPVILPTGETRYEMRGKDHHHHFLCRTCENVFDIDVCPVSIPRGTTFPGNYLVESHDLTIYGVCPQCMP